MKLTKKEAERIADEYDLGKVKEIRLINEGGINYNFDIKTEKGSFIIRFLGHYFDETSKRKLKLEFKVLNFLKEKKFSYQIPFPVKNKKRKFSSIFGERNFWVYKKLDGKIVKKLNEKKLREMAILLATYHKFIKKLKLKKYEKIHSTRFFNLNWLIKKYSHMEVIKPKNNTDKLILENFEFFKNVLRDLIKIKFNKNIITTHSDFHKENILFEGNKIIGLLDFDNLETLPLIEDLASAIQNNCFKSKKLNKNKMEIFLKEYEKINKLNKEEKEMIIPAILRQKCIGFWWFYSEMKKRREKRHDILKGIIKETKNLVKGLKK